MAWLCKYIFVEDLPRYEADGWKYWGPGPNLGGWGSVIVRRRA